MIKKFTAIKLLLLLTSLGLGITLNMNQAQSGSKENLVFVGTVRADKGYLWRFDGSGDSTKIASGNAKWDTCPQGTTLLGHDFQSNGFWICANPNLARRGTWYFGNVVNNAGYYWEIAGGKAKPAGGAKWDTCWEGRLRGRVFEPNGFWFCQP